MLCLPLAFWACGNDSGGSASDDDYSVVSDSESSSSSSKDVIASSSSINVIASSSAAKLSSSSVNSSDSGWSWDVPKEDRLNPEIEYGEMTDARDGKKYKTVEICNEDKSICQTWMAENLNYADSVKTVSLKGKSWCYDNKDANCDVAGRLYTWAATIDSAALANDAENPQTCGYRVECTLPATVQGICPDGWHLPSYEEWQTLFTAVGGSSNAGKALKSGFGWYSNGYGTDAYGFSALPAGYRNDNGYFDCAGDIAYFWSASQFQYEDYSYGAYDMDLGYYGDTAYLNYDGKYFGLSVRCLKD